MSTILKLICCFLSKNPFNFKIVDSALSHADAIYAYGLVVYVQQITHPHYLISNTYMPVIILFRTLTSLLYLISNTYKPVNQVLRKVTNIASKNKNCVQFRSSFDFYLKKKNSTTKTKRI